MKLFKRLHNIVYLVVYLTIPYVYVKADYATESPGKLLKFFNAGAGPHHLIPYVRISWQ